MRQFKRKKSFVAPFSQTSGASSPYSNVQVQQKPGNEAELKALSPVHLGRHVQTITPHTKQKIKQRFACGFSHVSTKDTSPGIYVPFELSQASHISRESVDMEGEIIHIEESGESEFNDEIVGTHLSDQNEAYTEDFDIELLQDAAVIESARNSAIVNTTNVPYGEEEIGVKVNQGLVLQNSGDEIRQITEPQLAQEQYVENVSGVSKEIVKRTKGKKLGKKSSLTRKNSFKVKISRTQNSNKVSNIEKTSLGTCREIKKQTKNCKQYQSAGSGGRRNVKGDDFCSRSMSCKSQGGTTRKRKRKRSFQVMKQEVLKTLNKMHREIQELLERRKKLCTCTNSSTDEGSTTRLLEKDTENDLVQEE